MRPGKWTLLAVGGALALWNVRLVAAADAVVAADGSAQYRTVQEAIDAAPQLTDAGAPRWVIQVKPGTYHERLYVQREKRFIILEGSGAASTIVTYELAAGQMGPDGKPIGTFRTPTMQVDADDFTVEDLTIANGAGPVGQAVALRVDGDRAVFRRCALRGWQDTLLVNRGRHYFVDCSIEGHVDFIFGAATAFFDRCAIHVLRDGYVTAASTPDHQAYGLVFTDCRITGEPGAHAYLGRPWRDYAATAFVRTELSDVIRPEGWNDWKKPQAHTTARYVEFANFGPGAVLAHRVDWMHHAESGESARYTPGAVLGGADGWNPARAPAVHLVGDSTMADKPDLGYPERGWGQALRPLVRTPWVVINHAVNGRSTKSFRTLGHWDAMLAQLQAGDWVIIEFGHNDAKKDDPARFADAATDYPANLKAFVREVRAHGANPVLATSVVRRAFEADGKLTDTHGAYLTAMRQVATEEKVPLLDMEKATRALVAGLGPEKSQALYVSLAPGADPRFPQGKTDNTHFTEAGAREVAGLAVKEMERLNLLIAGYFGPVPAVQISSVDVPPSPSDVTAAMHRVFAYQVSHEPNLPPNRHENPHGWINAVFYTGVMAAWRSTGDASYHDAAVRWSEAAHWEPAPRVRHADDYCCAQTYVELFLADGGPEKIAAFRRNADTLVADPKPGRVDWWWCDALFMGPPALARLAQATGDARYRDLMDRMYWDSVDFLFDPHQSLFFRDEHFLPGHAKPGDEDTYWSRGNGWVFAGLPRIIDFLPPHDPARVRYVALFQKMAARLLALQGADGYWRSDLLKPSRFPNPETSGTAFFGAGFAWGVRQHLLDRDLYAPALARAWSALGKAIGPDGRLGYAQPVGYKPAATEADESWPYASGGFLLFGSEILEDAGGIRQPDNSGHSGNSKP
ncbi:MAG TPA: pectinesterase family protein [Candidatus Didemnitutus sp.]|nr:pectinesterase family protein [Candidatus Didemnitutus sp.]